MTTNKRNAIAADIIDAVESATKKWTRQRKSEEKYPGNIRYRASRMTKVARTSQKDAAWKVMDECYLAVSGPRNLPALARQIYYKARPLIMEMTDDKELRYGYFSQVLLPDYIEEHSSKCKGWRVIYDARGHLQEPHTNRRIGIGTIEVDNYLRMMRSPEVSAADFSDASINIIGPAGGIAGVLFCEKEGFNPLFQAVDLANRHDLMIVSTKGVSVTAARKLVDRICGRHAIPLFVLHDFDIAGFMIAGTLVRDTRRYQFSSAIGAVDLGLRLKNIGGLEREPAAATKTNEADLRAQLKENCATEEEIEILLKERVELNALGSDELIELIEDGLLEYGLKKVMPDDKLLAKAYEAFHRGNELREKFEELEEGFEATEIKVPKNLRKKVKAILDRHPDLRWDDAVQVALDDEQLDRVREEKRKAKNKAGDFTDADDDEDEDGSE